REGAKRQGLPTGFPPDRRPRQLDLGNRPLLLRLAPQCEGHRTTAENLILPLPGEDVLELDVTQQRLSFGNEIVDDLVASSLDDDLLGRLSGLLGLGDGKGNLAFLLLRAFVRGGGRFFDRRCHLGCRDFVDHSRLILIGAVTCRRTSGTDQGYQHQGQRSLLHYAHLNTVILVSCRILGWGNRWDRSGPEHDLLSVRCSWP